MGVRENKVETYLDNSFKALGGLTRKWVSPGRTGVPDRICILNGRVIFAEVKTEDGEESVRQNREKKDLRDAGATVVIVYGHRDVDRLMYSVMHQLPLKEEEWN